MKTLNFHQPVCRIFLFMLTLMLWNCSSSADLILPANEDAQLKLKSGEISKSSDKADQIQPYYEFNQRSFDLILGSDIIGEFSIYTTSDKGNIFVSVTTNAGWIMKSVNLFIGDVNNLPINGSGKLMLKKFSINEVLQTNTYIYEFNSGTEPEYAVVFRSEVELIDADQQVINSGTVWVGDTNLGVKGSNGLYFIYAKRPG